MKKLYITVFILFFNFINANNYLSNVYTQTFKNGLQAVYIPTKSPQVTVAVAYSVGSINEESGKEGLAHLLEHMMFLGTHKFSQDKYLKKIHDIGAEYNAFTTFDVTIYHTTSISAYLSDLLEIEADRMQFLKLDKKAIQNEINVIIEESNMYQNQQYYDFGLAVEQSKFFSTNYARSIIGYKDTFNQITQQDVKNFYQKWYTPNNATVVIIGGFNLKQAKALVKRKFGSISSLYSNISNPKLYQEPLLADININYSSSKIKQNLIIKSFLAPSFVSDTSPNKQVSLSVYILQHIFNSKNNTLYYNLVRKNNLANDIGFDYYFNRKGTSAIDIYTLPNNNSNTNLLLQQFNASLNLYKNNIITQQQVNTAVKNILADLEFSKENEHDFAINIAHWLALGVSVSQINNAYNQLQNITAQQVNNTLNLILSGKSITSIATYK